MPILAMRTHASGEGSCAQHETWTIYSVGSVVNLLNQIEDTMRRKTSRGQGIGLGLALGVAFGAVFGNVGVGIALGVAFGAAFDWAKK